MNVSYCRDKEYQTSLSLADSAIFIQHTRRRRHLLDDISLRLESLTINYLPIERRNIRKRKLTNIVWLCSRRKLVHLIIQVESIIKIEFVNNVGLKI